jgi:hypothetical protein
MLPSVKKKKKKPIFFPVINSLPMEKEPATKA